MTRSDDMRPFRELQQKVMRGGVAVGPASSPGADPEIWAEYHALEHHLGPGFVSDEAANATVPVRHADIHWNDEKDGKVEELVVFDRHAGHYVEDNRLSSALGACTGGWMLGHPGGTPEGVFIHLVRDGFASPLVLLKTLQQFGKIDTCDWARTMAVALEFRLEGDGTLADEDED